MVDTIYAAVSGAPREGALGPTIWHGIGLLLGSSVVALLLILVNAGLNPTLSHSRLIWGLLALLALGWAFKPLGALGLPYPRSHWQVPEQWRHLMPIEITMLAYGVLLGLGFLTDVVFPAYWLLVLVSIALGSPLSIMVAWSLYALTRFGVTLLWFLEGTGDSFSGRFIGRRKYAAALHAVIVGTFPVTILVLKGGA